MNNNGTHARRIAALEQLARPTNGRYAPFSWDMINALLENRTPENMTAEEWSATQARSAACFNFAAVERILRDENT